MRHSTVVVTLALCAVVAAACGGGKAERLEKFNVAGAADPSQYVDVPAVVLLERLKLTFSFSAKQWQPYAELEHTRRVQVLSADGLSLRKIYIPFDSTSGVLDVTARIIHPDGKTKELGQVPTLDFDRFAPQHPAHALYNEPAARVFALKELSVGDIVEYRYRRVIKDASWSEPLRLGGPFPIERGEVQVIYPEGFDVDFRVFKGGKRVERKPERLPERVFAEPGQRSGDGVPATKLLWVFEKLPALYPEPLRPADEALATQVLVQFKAFFFNGRSFDGFRDWNDVAKWYGRLIGDLDAADSSAKRVAKEIGATQAVSKQERVQRINRYLADNLVPIDFDGSLASLKVHGPAAVLGAKSGDAKDLASTALALLRAAGVEGFPVLCQKRGTRALSPDLPTPESFNAVVVAVASGGGYSFFAPDGYGLPAGRLPWRVQGTRGLLIRRSGAELVDLPEDAPGANRRDLEVHLGLGSDGHASGNAMLTLTGQDAGLLRLGLKRADAAGRLELVQRFLFSEGSKVVVTDVQEPKGAADGEQPLRLLATLASRDLAKPFESLLRFSLTDVLGKPQAFLWREGRRTALDLGYRYDERLNVAVTLPEGTGVLEKPVERKADGKLLRLDDRFAVSDAQFRMLRETSLRAGRIEPEDYGDFKSLYEGVWLSQEALVKVGPGGDRGQSYGGEPF